MSRRVVAVVVLGGGGSVRLHAGQWWTTAGRALRWMTEQRGHFCRVPRALVWSGGTLGWGLAPRQRRALARWHR